jgi:integrase
MVSTPRVSKSGPKPRRPRGDGSVFKDKDSGRWVARWWDNGVRRKATAATKLDVVAKMNQARNRAPAPTKPGTITVAGLLTEWTAKALPNKRLVPTSIERHDWARRRWTDEIGNVRLVDLDVATIERVLTHWAEEGLSRATLRDLRGTLGMACKWALVRRDIDYDPVAGVELPAINKKRAKNKKALDDSDIKKLLDELRDHPHYPMFVVMASLGLRPGEAAALCADAIDLDAGTLTVKRGIQRRNGRPILVERVKTEGSARTLRMPAHVAGVLAPLLEAENVADDALLFTGPSGLPIWPSTTRVLIENACKKAGVPRISPHEFRHHAATRMVNNGVPLTTVADALGHAGIRQLDRTYRHPPAVVAIDE